MEKLNMENVGILPSINRSLQLADIRLLLSCDMGTAKVREMITAAKRNYVLTRHNRKIFQLPPSKSWKSGCYKTYVYVNSKRRDITACTEEKLIEKLYDFYYNKENTIRSLQQAFDAYMDYKKSCLNRSDKTIYDDKVLIRQVSKELLEEDIAEITDEKIQRFIVSTLLPKTPKPDLLKRLLQLLRAVFDFAIRKKICYDNPLKYIVAQDYYKYCNQKVKTDEEKAFSSEELDRLSRDAEDHLDNPRVLIALLAQETGMRVGELTALHKDDVNDKFIHVNRQQIKEGNEIKEVPYTKNERLHPHNGRYIPLTEEAKRIVSLANDIPGESLYLFHDSNKPDMITKDSYILNLRRRCKRLGCLPTNNHAFRMAFNSKLIELGFSSSDRALILGHEVQTNEAYYSLTDKRRLEIIEKRLNKKEP